MAPSSVVRVERRDGVGRLVLCRPPVNVLDIATIRELDGAFRELASDRAIGMVVLTSGIEKSFSTGVDVKDHTPDRIPEMLSTFHGLLRTIATMEQPVVAAVTGVALGGGLELLLACDLAVAAEDARFGLPEIGLACFPPVALALLPSRIGHQAAAELILTGEPIGARRAFELGLVNRIVPRAGLEAEVDALVASLRAKSPSVLRLTGSLLKSEPAWLGRLEAIERAYLDRLAPMADCQEGVRAFIEKRKPVWSP